MKSIRRILSIVACFMLLVSLSLVAFAASSPFFRKDYAGYRCIGSGSVSDTPAKAVFNAMANPDQMHIPGYDCSSEAWVFAHNRDGEVFGSSHTKGTTSASATYIATQTIVRAGYNFVFNGNDFGFFSIANN